MRRMLQLDEERRSPSEVPCFEKVVPRLLKPLDRRGVKLVLLHGDLRIGNAGTAVAKGKTQGAGQGWTGDQGAEVMMFG